MPKRAIERLVITVELHPAAVRVASSYHDYTGIVGVTTRSVPIPAECRHQCDRLSDLLDVPDDVVTQVKLWVNQLRLF